MSEADDVEAAMLGYRHYETRDAAPLSNPIFTMCGRWISRAEWSRGWAQSLPTATNETCPACTAALLRKAILP